MTTTPWTIKQSTRRKKRKQKQQQQQQNKTAEQQPEQKFERNKWKALKLRTVPSVTKHIN